VVILHRLILFYYYSTTLLKAISSISVDVTVPLSVCLSVCLHCVQTAENIDTIFAAYLWTQDRVKIWFTAVNRSILKFCHKVTQPLLIWVSDTFDRKWLEIAQWS